MDTKQNPYLITKRQFVLEPQVNDQGLLTLIQVASNGTSQGENSFMKFL